MSDTTGSENEKDEVLEDEEASDDEEDNNEGEDLQTEVRRSSRVTTKRHTWTTIFSSLKWNVKDS